MILAVLYFVLAILIYLILVQHPSHVGIEIEDKAIVDRVERKMKYVTRHS